MTFRGELASAPILYSTNTWLAYTIARTFYGNLHYVWCTPHFDPRQNGRDTAVPPTSSPCEMYRTLHEETSRGERHSARISENKVGIRRGAAAKLASGVITDAQKDQIASILDAAQTFDFRPLLYVIPVATVSEIVREPPPEDKAHPLSAEFIIDELPRGAFDVIEFGGRI